MADDDVKTDSTEGTDQSPEGAGGSEADPQKVIEDLRKRQSGADKAREVAIAQRDELQARLDAALSGKGKADDGQSRDEAAIRAEVSKEFEQKLASERAADLAKVLDAQFPAARKRFPGVTDPAQLVELEEFFGEPKAAPKPIGNNPQGSGSAKSIDDMSIKELKASLDGQLAGVLKAQ